MSGAGSGNALWGPSLGVSRVAETSVGKGCQRIGQGRLLLCFEGSRGDAVFLGFGNAVFATLLGNLLAPLVGYVFGQFFNSCLLLLLFLLLRLLVGLSYRVKIDLLERLLAVLFLLRCDIADTLGVEHQGVGADKKGIDDLVGILRNHDCRGVHEQGRI